MTELRIGTCSWNYPSWLGLVYTTASRTAAGYLGEYSRRFRTAEIDSWFYKLPERREVLDYLAPVDEDFRFTVKVSEDICLTHRRNRGSKDLVANPDFLSPALFSDYLGRIEPMLPRIDAVMLEFEYLNRDKMKSLDAFLRALETFVATVPSSIPLAVETRNKNYLGDEYFAFLREKGIIHVFSEKLYLPHVYEVYADHADAISGTSVIRLLGGDRKEIEEKTGNAWNRLVDEKPDKARVAEMSRDLLFRGGRVVININNHYEGSAPLTATYFEKALG